MPKRFLNDWLTAYLKYTENSESPVSYHLWSGVSTIAAALQRKVYFRWGHTTHYPNQYIILVGPSGQSRKGEPIAIARSMVKNLRIAMLADDNTMESIAREMANAVTSFTDRTTRRITYQCAVSSITEELSVLLGEQNTRLLSYLTNWYDSRADWTRSTKNQGVDDIQGVCLNLLSATAPDWIPYIFSRAAIGGGFTSRCIFVVEERKGKIISNPNRPDLQPPPELRKQLRHDLEIIHTITGEYSFSPKALAAYERWYTEEEEKIKQGNPSISDPMFAGYVSRRPAHLFKICMALTASRTSEREIGEKDFNRALTMLRIAEKKMPKVFGGVGKARYIEETETVLNHLEAVGSTTKSQLLRKYMRLLDSNSLDIVMSVLQDMKVVKITREPGKDVTYEYKVSKAPRTIQ